MKKAYGICLCAFAVILGVAYYTSYRYSLKRFDDTEVKEEQIALSDDDELLPVDTTKEDRITNKTNYTLEYYDSKNYSLREESLPIPADFIGLSREELIDYLKEYESSPSIEDVEGGFEKFEVVSFSSNSIILRKTYYPVERDYKYYLIAENNYVTVYYMDKTTVYSYTDIHLNNLPEKLQQEIAGGKYVLDMKELYDFLENYSS